MPKYEFMEVGRVSVEKLNELGAEGWTPCALRHEDPVYSRVLPDQQEGWTGLLMRQVREETHEEETQDDDSER